MFNERNIRIEAAIYVFQLAVEHFTHSLDDAVYEKGWFDSSRKAYHAMLNAKNELYDAIGGMECYKYQINEGETK
jgi:hypothetical protein